MKKKYIALLVVGALLGYFVGSLFLHEARAQLTSRDEVVFDDFDLTSTSTVYSEAQLGTGEEGWITVANEETKAVEIRVNTINATSIDCHLEGRLFQATQSLTTPSQIWPASGEVSFTVTGSQIIELPDTLWQLRIGCKVTADTGVQELTVIYNWFPGRRL